MKIDTHNHAIPPASIELLKRNSVYNSQVRDNRIYNDGQPAFDLIPAFVTAEGKLAELRKFGLDAAIVSSSPSLFYYEVDADAGQAMAETVNQGLAEMCAADTSLLHWMATVPMQDPQRAPAMLDSAKAAGAVGVEVGTCIAGARLDEPRFEPFWAAVDRLGLPVMLHPAYNEPNGGLGPYYFQNVIGNQLETTITVERLIASGLLDRHPTVQLLLVHSGGYFPYQAGRYRHARTVREELASSPADPWSYVGRQLHFDVITHDRQALQYLISRVGAESVVMGTDLPFDMAMTDAVQVLAEVTDAATAERIAETNPAALFGV
ncbi:MAG TPA: amidohydrolase family protein [Candidatus Acidoferrales bacterium]|nr:amidohydrolase family protein [Candidatus Acidoferrales bacterium]